MASFCALSAASSRTIHSASFHVLSSLKQYGQTHEPKACCEYDTVESQCTQPSEELYYGLDDKHLRARAARAEVWLQSQAYWQGEAQTVEKRWKARQAATAREASASYRVLEGREARLSVDP